MFAGQALTFFMEILPEGRHRDRLFYLIYARNGLFFFFFFVLIFLPDQGFLFYAAIFSQWVNPKAKSDPRGSFLPVIRPIFISQANTTGFTQYLSPRPSSVFPSMCASKVLHQPVFIFRPARPMWVCPPYTWIAVRHCPFLRSRLSPLSFEFTYVIILLRRSIGNSTCDCPTLFYLRFCGKEPSVPLSCSVPLICSYRIFSSLSIFFFANRQQFFRHNRAFVFLPFRFSLFFLLKGVTSSPLPLIYVWIR